MLRKTRSPQPRADDPLSLFSVGRCRGQGSFLRSAEKSAWNASCSTRCMNKFLRTMKRAQHCADRLQRELLAPYGITPARYELLLDIHETGMPQKMQSEVSHDLGVSPMTVSTMTRSLEREGLLRRTPSIVDRRQVELALTKKGLALVARIEKDVVPVAKQKIEGAISKPYRAEALLDEWRQSNGDPTETW